MSLANRMRGVLLALTGFGLTGCPALLDDNFSTVPFDPDVETPMTGGRSGNGGAIPGKGGELAGNETGGAPQAGSSGANAGKSGGGGTTSGSAGSEANAGGGGATGDGGAGTDCSDCGPNKQCCGDVCVDTRFDPNNCLECGHGCPGTTCDNSSCTNTCAQGFIDCNKNVVDGCEVNPAIDPSNCGNCGIGCGFQLECVKGYCVCPANTADCDGNKANGCEVDTSSDKGNCGACGKACAANQGCSGSKCGCAVGFLDCNGSDADGCEAAVTAVSSCGSCGFDCGPHGTCLAAGQCGCSPGYLDCDASTPGCETPINDPAHCGSCGVACPVNLPACNGTTCIVGCGALTACGSSCVDTTTDPENCGGCGKPVGSNQTCVAGKPTCAAGFADCDGALGCEINIQTDDAHCGSCTKACKAGATCASGSCACAPTTPNDCGASCAQCCDASQCSDGDSCTADACSNGVCSSGLQCTSGAGSKCCSGTGCFECCGDADCGGGKVCTGGQCLNLVCPAPQIACNLKCVDPTNDPKNCGGCDSPCGPGRACSASGCTPKWVAMAAPPAGFVAREKAAYAALGNRVLVWGGNNAAGTALATGALYDPATDSWAGVATSGAPTARILATAVWTGTVAVVWGGGDVAANTDYNSGGRYDPVSNSWQSMTTTGAPSGRRGAYGFWTGSRVLFYGGTDRNGNASAAVHLYDPVNNTWATASTPNGPTVRTDPAVGWTGSLLLVYGGRVGTNYSDTTHALDPAANAWTRAAQAPSQRAGTLGTWDGSLLLAWGGTNGMARSDGKLYDPATDKWTAMQAAGAPSARLALNRQTGWSARMKPRLTLMVGGFAANGTLLTDGGIYNSTTNTWSPIGAWPSGAAHLWGVGVWTGTELVLWSGRSSSGATLTSAGERYLP